MNFLITIIIIAIVGFIIPASLPWWTPFILCFLVGLALNTKSGISFLGGFSGMTILWGIGIFLAYQNGASIIAGRMTTLLQAPNQTVLISITLLISGTLGGLACFSGNSLRNLLQPK